MVSDASAIHYVVGDATKPQGEGPKFILHIVNDLGLWGAGFVLALSRRWSAPEECYYTWGGPYVLGQVQSVKVEDDLWVMNMVGQHGVGRSGDPPIRYEALRECLQWAAKWAHDPLFRGPYKVCSVHAPRFGSGLAGGSWDVISGIISETLVAEGVPVTIYDFPG
jgi:O-acetyl-ADP-ribose deacetylase (regulator of RNase III)